jgi:hypothetical protein
MSSHRMKVGDLFIMNNDLSVKTYLQVFRVTSVDKDGYMYESVRELTYVLDNKHYAMTAASVGWLSKLSADKSAQPLSLSLVALCAKRQLLDDIINDICKSTST